MKLIEAINNVDKSPDNTIYPNIDEFCEELGIYDSLGWDDSFNERVKGYRLKRWYCTDTWVGTVVWEFDGDPVAISHQPARKSSTKYLFINKILASNLRDFIQSLINRENNLQFIEEDEEIDEYFSVSYSSQLLDHIGFYNSKKCEVIDYNRKDFICSTVIVQFEDGTTKEISVEEFKIPLKLNL